MTDLAQSPLGHATAYADAYDPSLLFAVDRAPQREELGIGGELPFHGADAWTAWEASWLDPEGRPRSAVVTFAVPCASRRIVESKSVKLYFASLHATVFADVPAFASVLARDLGGVVGADVGLSVYLPEVWERRFARREPEGRAIDDAALPALPRHPDPALLRARPAPGTDVVRFRSFRSVCPVTGQPDHADVTIATAGCRMDDAALLAYLAGFRHHPGFHEHCVERIFADVSRACSPAALHVCARFTRRGGIDISPWRTSDPGFAPDPAPTLRQ